MICKNCGYAQEGEPTYCSNCGTMIDKMTNQGSQNPGPSNLGLPNQIPQYQGPQYGGSYQGQQYGGPNQGQQFGGLSQSPPYQQAPNQQRPYQQSSGALPPPVPFHLQMPPKRNPVLLPVLIVVIILYVLFVLSAIGITVFGIIDAAGETDMDQLADEYGLYQNEDFSDAFEGFDDFGYSYDEFDTQEESYQYYDTFIQAREIMYYEQYTEVVMDNGIGFYMNDIVVTDLGDGTAVVDVNIDLTSYSMDNYLYQEDFLILPMDKAGNALADACSVEYIMDSNGATVLIPMLLDTEEYENYTISFLVPTDMETFNMYGCNYTTEGFSGPVYCTEMLLDE